MSEKKYYQSINPATGEKTGDTALFNNDEIDKALQRAADCREGWCALSFAERTDFMRKVARRLTNRRDELAGQITDEMGKLLKEARSEVEKCSWVCEFYAEQAEQFLADESVQTEATQSYVAYQPLGTILAIMPWNFPFWQVFRFAAPALMSGNTTLLKHAANVPRCSQMIESLFEEAGFPDGVFINLYADADQVASVIVDDRISAVTLTGSVTAGSSVAKIAGGQIKKTVLELGGSDPFIILADADLDKAAETAVRARYMNAGQSCIAAKRFIVIDSVADNFVAHFKPKVAALRPGHPRDDETTLAPMARDDLRSIVHEQVQDSINKGAEPTLGCGIVDRPGFYYQASILDHVSKGMRTYNEEVFGPVASIIRARDIDHAITLANDNQLGLGGSIWTADKDLGNQLARQLECGCVFINEMVKSDPRIPFGGIKRSGYGRELSWHGIREFVNTKTIWVD